MKLRKEQITAFLLLLSIAVFFVPQIKADVQSFGYNQIGTFVGGGIERISLSKYLLTENANITSMSFFEPTAGFMITLYIYPDNSGVPATLPLLETVPKNCSVGWNTFIYASSGNPIATTLTAGYYWLGFKNSVYSTNDFVYDLGGSSYQVGQTETYQISIFADYTIDNLPLLTNCTVSINNGFYEGWNETNGVHSLLFGGSGNAGGVNGSSFGAVASAGAGNLTVNGNLTITSGF